MLERYFSAGRYVILDSGFCVLKVIVELKKEGLYAGALIKKQRYCTSLVSGKKLMHTSTINKLARPMPSAVSSTTLSTSFGE